MDINVALPGLSDFLSLKTLIYSRARAATAAPTAPMFEPKTCAAPVAALTEDELVVDDEVDDPAIFAVSYHLRHTCPQQ